jgi:hypothetical protein
MGIVKCVFECVLDWVVVLNWLRFNLGFRLNSASGSG